MYNPFGYYPLVKPWPTEYRMSKPVKRRVRDFHFARGRTIDELEGRVRELLQDGYEICGPLDIDSKYYPRPYLLPVIKYEEEEDD